jgi:putative ABC transport system permease protein
MICVATTMMAIVTERRREIGLKKALGASDRKIAAEFLGEGFVLGILGGTAGFLLGYWFSRQVGASVFNRSIEFHPGLFPVTLSISIVITILACLLPVKIATTVEPAMVLRGE